MTRTCIRCKRKINDTETALNLFSVGDFSAMMCPGCGKWMHGKAILVDGNEKSTCISVYEGGKYVESYTVERSLIGA